MDSIYRDYYGKYRNAVYSDSSQAVFYYGKANDYYKLSRFLFYTAAGIWAYSVINAYVDAHIYNAQQQIKMLDINDKQLQMLKQDTGDR